MGPMISAGDLLLCEECDGLESDEIGLFVINGRNICVKKYIRKMNGVALVSADRRWTECFFPDGEDNASRVKTAARENNTFRIEAKVIQCIHRFI